MADQPAFHRVMSPRRMDAVQAIFASHFAAFANEAGLSPLSAAWMAHGILSRELCELDSATMVKFFRLMARAESGDSHYGPDDFRRDSTHAFDRLIAAWERKMGAKNDA
jgi:hypothetical protein